MPDPSLSRVSSVSDHPHTRMSPADIVLRFSGVSLVGDPELLALACVEIGRELTGRARLVLPISPVPLAVGDQLDGLSILARFPAPGGEGELWAERTDLPASIVTTLEEQLTRIWAVQREREARERELDQLRFHLTALQQVTHTLSVVRGTEETEQLALDSGKEVFFAW